MAKLFDILAVISVYALKFQQVFTNSLGDPEELLTPKNPFFKHIGVEVNAL